MGLGCAWWGARDRPLAARLPRSPGAGTLRQSRKVCAELRKKRFSRHFATEGKRKEKIFFNLKAVGVIIFEKMGFLLSLYISVVSLQPTTETDFLPN